MRWLAGVALALLVACAAPPKREPSGTILREQSRWVPVTWGDLPGWDDDAPRQAWPALLRSCQRPAPEWVTTCAQAARDAPRDDEQARAWLERNLRPYRVETLQGESRGLATGYYEPVFEARREPRPPYRFPLYARPADLEAGKPYWSRRDIDTLPQAKASLRGHEIAYVADPLDALVLQIQGSGRLRITEADGQESVVRLAFAGHNDRPYGSVGRWLVEQGELPAGQATWPAIRDWAARNPKRLHELLWSNPRYVFFREEPLPDPAIGPRGAQGVPLTPGRSIAVDPRSVPYGTPVWIDTTEPLTGRPLQRLVVAQDTGGAIVGAVRVDYFWGWDGTAAEQAGRMRQPLRVWVLRPR